MNWLALGTALLTLSTLTSCQDPPKCGEPGVWTECETIAYSEGAKYGDCLQKCQLDPTCTHFTFLTSTKKDSCLLHTNCKAINPDLCKTCVSGERSCKAPDEPVCNQRQCCLDTPTEILQDIKDETICLERCHNLGISNCKFYTYISGSETCLHYPKTCALLHPSNDCSSGDRDCLSLPPPTCDGNFCCAEKEVDRFEHADLKTCQEKCTYSQTTPTCKWFSVDLGTNICYHYTECDDRTEQNCITGESRCPL